jgi:predicted  nucleic acid-binding Zn-ribbon protein
MTKNKLWEVIVDQSMQIAKLRKLMDRGERELSEAYAGWDDAYIRQCEADRKAESLQETIDDMETELIDGDKIIVEMATQIAQLSDDDKKLAQHYQQLLSRAEETIAEFGADVNRWMQVATEAGAKNAKLRDLLDQSLDLARDMLADEPKDSEMKLAELKEPKQ